VVPAGYDALMQRVRSDINRHPILTLAFLLVAGLLVSSDSPLPRWLRDVAVGAFAWTGSEMAPLGNVGWAVVHTLSMIGAAAFLMLSEQLMKHRSKIEQGKQGRPAAEAQQRTPLV
jgi:hypothetical protein